MHISAEVRGVNSSPPLPIPTFSPIFSRRVPGRDGHGTGSKESPAGGIPAFRVTVRAADPLDAR